MIFPAGQKRRLKDRREYENPSVVLDFFAARAILEEGVENFWRSYRLCQDTRAAEARTLLPETLVDLAARCQQVAEDLNMVDEPPENEADHNQNLVKFTRDLLSHIMRNARQVPAEQRGKHRLSFMFDEHWMRDTLEELDKHVFPPPSTI